MTLPVGQFLEVELLVEKYEGLRPRVYRTPDQLLGDLHSETDERVLPCINLANERMRNIRCSLEELAIRFVQVDKPGVDQRNTAFARTQANGEDIVREAELLERQLATLPPSSPEANRVLKQLNLRVVELELVGKKLESYSASLHSSMEAATSLIEQVKGPHRQIEEFRKKFTKAMLRLKCLRVGASLTTALPPAIALIVTVMCDKATPWLEHLAHTLMPSRNHIIVLLLLFAVQVPVLTPVISTWNAKLCWRTFDRTVAILRSLSIDLRAIDQRLLEIEEQTRHLWAANVTER